MDLDRIWNAAVETLPVLFVVAIIAIVYVGVNIFRKGKDGLEKGSVEKNKRAAQDDILKKQSQSPYWNERRGKYISAPSWNIFYRPLLSIGAGALLLAVLLLIDFALAYFVGNGDMLMNWWLSIIVVVGLTVYVIRNEGKEKHVVENNHAAVLTFFGMPISLWGGVYLEAGDYGWFGRRLFLDRNTLVKEPGTNKHGDVMLGPIQLPIWNENVASSKDAKLILQNTAKNDATFFNTLIIVFQLYIPITWLSVNNPTLDVAERARSAFRTVASYFTDRDNVALKSVLGKLMSGYWMVTAFLPERNGRHVQGSIIRDHAEVPLQRICRSLGKSQEEIDAGLAKEKTAFQEMLQQSVDPKLLGTLKLSVIHVGETIDEVMDRVGANIIDASIGHMALSGKVIEESDKASSEAAQYTSRLASAQSIKAARKELAADETEKNDPNFQIHTMLGAAQDDERGNVNFKILEIPALRDAVKAIADVVVAAIRK